SPCAWRRAGAFAADRRIRKGSGDRQWRHWSEYGEHAASPPLPVRPGSDRPTGQSFAHSFAVSSQYLWSSFHCKHQLATYVFVDGPVKDVVVLESFADKQVAENLAEIRIVWLVVEAERA